MRKSCKYALDKLFLFMLFVSIGLFAVEMMFEIENSIVHAVEYIDLMIIGGYYVYFFQGLSKAKEKLIYCKKHVFLIILLVLPVFPLARMLRLPLIEKMFKIGSDVAWHLLDEVGML